MRLGVLLQYAPEPLQLPTFPLEHLPTSILPSISIVTPSYMQADFLDATIDSITRQNYPQLEYIIMDGGSTDTSPQIIKQHTDSITYWESKKDNGQADAVKQGFEKSSGEIMAWLNSDDLYLPGLLQFVGEFFARNPEVDVLYGNRIIIDEHGDEVGRWVLPGHDTEMLLWNDYIPQETMFWRRSLYEEVGGIDDRFQFALDWDLLLRFHRAGAKMVHLPHFMACFRAHENQKSSAWIGSIGMEEITQLRKRELGGQFTEKKLQSLVNRFQLKAVLHNKLAKWKTYI
jgi:glycosyltransferase involved in cell wall biosynthesis